MFKACMGCTWKDEVGGTQLFQVAESLKFGSIYDFYHQRGELDESVNGVIYLLHSVVDLNVHLLIQIDLYKCTNGILAAIQRHDKNAD